MKIKEYNYEPIGARIKSARQKKKYTQEFVAKKIDVGIQHISDIERGISGVSIPTLMELCALLEVSADYILFGFTDTEDSPINSILKKMNPQQAMYAEEFVKLYAKSCGVDKI